MIFPVEPAASDRCIAAWGVQMGYHSQDGRTFLGKRVLPNGCQQIVYDTSSGQRVLITIGIGTMSSDEIDAVIREGIIAQKVLHGVLKALHARNIYFEMS